MAAVNGAGVVTSAPATTHDLDQMCIDTIRTLSIDAIEAANSGIRAPSGSRRSPTRCGSGSCARPADPIWPNRDRFVLSAATPPICCGRCSI